MLASLQRNLMLVLANGAFQPQHHLFRGLGLFTEDGFGLTSVTGLLAIVTPFSLGMQTGLSSLVLGDLVRRVFAAFGAWAESVARLWNIHHCCDKPRKSKYQSHVDPWPSSTPCHIKFTFLSKQVSRVFL